MNLDHFVSMHDNEIMTVSQAEHLNKDAGHDVGE